MKKYFILFFLTCLHNFKIFAQDSIAVQSLKKSYFDEIIFEKNKVVFPKIKDYNVELIGSNNQSVIDLKGNIHQPLINKSVSLLFKVSSKKNKNMSAEIPSKNVSIKGKYASNSGNKQPFVIPSLREWKGDNGEYQFSKKSRIIFSDTSVSAKEAANLLQEDLKKLLDFDISVLASNATKAEKGDILINSSKNFELGKEGYLIKIGDVFEINAPFYSGKVFGTRTLLQLLDQNKENLSIVKGEARDYPTYEVRGFMLDVGRKFFTIDFLNKYVEMMSYYKMSNFQIHLNDNAFHKYFDFDWNKTPSGFRLESETYPNLASKDGFYTKKEFVDLQKKALKYGVTIIPEIDVPAHSLAIVHAIPEIGSSKYGMDHLDLHHPKTYEVVKNIFDEYTKGPNPTFIGNEVHVGTDEYDKAEAEKFRYFTDFVFKTVQDNGKDVRAWGALTHAKGTTPVRVKGVTLNSWYNGYGAPIEMKKLGYPQISTPDGYLYIVPFAGYYYDYLNADYLYNNWSPKNIGDVTFEEGDPIVRGGMFAVWNDIAGNGISEKDVHNRAFPAVQVLAQKMWTGEDSKPLLYEFNSKKAAVIEAPGLNMRGSFGQYNPGLIYNLTFDNNLKNSAKTDLKEGKATNVKFNKNAFSSLEFANSGSELTLPFEEIGEEYTVSFWINPSKELSGDLFTSKNATVYYDENGLGYSRDGYKFTVDYKLPLNVWSLVTVTGDKLGAQFYLNNKLVKDMKPYEVELATKDKKGEAIKFKKIQTLVFPLKKVTINDAEIADFKVFNRKLNNFEIADLFKQK